jgi:TP901 family phage tail tape measure protein
MSTYLKAGTVAVEVIGVTTDVQKKFKDVVGGFTGLAAHARDFAMSVASIRPMLSTLSNFSVPLQVFAGFEFGMSKVKAVARATTDEIIKLREQAKELGKTSFFTASQVSDAQKFLGMAGFNAKQILDATPATLNLALAGDIDLGTAADIATNISTPFKIAAKDLGIVNDILAKAATTSNSNVQELGQAFKYAAPAASAAGQSLEECGAAMSILANNGIKADTAGTSVRMMLVKLADSGVQEKLKELFNIDVTDAAGKMKPFLSILQEVKTATAGLGQTGQMSAFYDIFEQRAGTAALVLGNAGDAITDFRLKMLDAGGTAADMAKTMSDNLKGDVISFQSAFEAIQIAFGSAINGLSRPLLKMFTDATRASATFINTNQDLVRNITLLGSGLITLKTTTGAFNLIRSGFLSLVPASSSAATAEQANAVAVNSATAAIAAQTAAIKANTAEKMKAVIADAKSTKTAIANQLATIGGNLTNLNASKAALVANLGKVTSEKSSWQKLLPTATGKDAVLIQNEINTLKAQEAVLNQRIAATSAEISAAETRRAALTRAASNVNITMANQLNTLTAQQISATNALAVSQTRVTLATRVSAMSTAAMTTVTATATRAMNALKTSLMTNPIMWVGAAVAGLAALTYQLTVAREKAAELTDVMSKKRESGDQTRSVDERKMKRLQQLADQQKLSNAEMKEAEKLTAELEGRYGDFGITIDTVANSIDLAADSMTKFMESMNTGALKQLEDELREGQKNFQELQKQAESTGWYWRSVFANITFGSVDTGEDAQKRLGEQQIEQLKKNAEIRKKINAIQNGENALDIAKDPTALLDEKISQTESAQQKNEDRMTAILKSIISSRRTSLENEIEELKERNSEYKTYLNLLLKAENAKPSDEIDKKRVAQLSELLENADAGFQVDLERLAQKNNLDTGNADKNIPDFEQLFRLQERLNSALESENFAEVKFAKDELDKLKKTMEETSFKNIQTSLQNALQDLSFARENYEVAQETGSETEIMLAAQQFSEAAKKANELNAAYEDISESLYEEKAKRAARFDEIGTSGTFNADAASMFGVGNYQQRMLGLVGKLVTNTDPQATKQNPTNQTPTQTKTQLTTQNESEQKLLTLTQEQNRLLRDLVNKSKSSSSLTFT